MSDFGVYLSFTIIGAVLGGMIGALFGQIGVGLAVGGPLGVAAALYKIDRRR